MCDNPVARALLTRTCLPVLLFLATPVTAQTDWPGGWAVVPSLGFGAVHDGGWGSAGMEVAAELDYTLERWRWSGHGSLRGLGVGCSHACFDGGPAVAIGVSRALGALWIGGGVGVMKQFGQWRPLPHGRISLDAAPFRFDMRVELPQHSGRGVYLPILIGIPVPR